MDSHHQPRAKTPGFSALQRRVDAIHQNFEGMGASNSKSPFLLVCDSNLHVPVQEHSLEILGGEDSGFQEAMCLWCELAVTMATTGLMSTGGGRRAPRKKSNAKSCSSITPRSILYTTLKPSMQREAWYQQRCPLTGTDFRVLVINQSGAWSCVQRRA